MKGNIEKVPKCHSRGNGNPGFSKTSDSPLSRGRHIFSVSESALFFDAPPLHERSKLTQILNSLSVISVTSVAKLQFLG
jgi:hypothetical protein